MTRVRGIRGEVAVIPMTSRPERYAELPEITLFRATGESERQEIESVWQHGDRWIFKFRGIDSIDAAERFAGCELRIPKSRRAALPEGEFYYSDLLGCEVIEQATGESLGKVTNWHEFGGPGLIEVGELLIPFAKAIFTEIDLASRRIVVNLPEGLKDLGK